jgi:hypothetical protein
MKNFGRGMWRRVGDYEKYLQQMLFIEKKEANKKPQNNVINPPQDKQKSK